MKTTKLVLRTRAERIASIKSFYARFDGTFVGPVTPSIVCPAYLSPDSQDKLYLLMSYIKTSLNTIFNIRGLLGPSAGSYEVFMGEPRDLTRIWDCFATVKIVWTSRIRTQTERLTEPYWSGRGVVVEQQTWFDSRIGNARNHEIENYHEYVNSKTISYFMMKLRDHYLAWDEQNPRWEIRLDPVEAFHSFSNSLAMILPTLFGETLEFLEDEMEQEREQETYCARFCDEYGGTPMEDLDMSVYDDKGEAGES